MQFLGVSHIEERLRNTVVGNVSPIVTQGSGLEELSCPSKLKAQPCQSADCFLHGISKTGQFFGETFSDTKTITTDRPQWLAE